MTNFEAWHFYMKDCTSPESYITMGFYGMISAALQRRVYLGSDERPLFSNMYTILVGEPAVGKGNVIVPITNILKTHKLKTFRVPTKDKVTSMPSTEQSEAIAAMMAEFEAAQNVKPEKGIGKIKDPPLLFPISADSATYAALVQDHAASLRSIFPLNNTSKLLKSGLYTHSSLCCCLEEISTLFTKHVEDVVNYLIKSFDCQDFKKRTKDNGTDDVKNPCMNFIGGTTPGFMQDAFNDKLLNEGFASRTVFVFEEEPRAYIFDDATYSEEQLEAKDQVIRHLELLSKLFGHVTYTPDAYEYLKHYIEVTIGRDKYRVNPSPKLVHYYGRKKVHVRKLAMAIHFAESTDMRLGLSACQRAVELLDKLELRMDKALNFGGRNPLATVAVKVLKFLEKRPANEGEIWKEFVNDMNATELAEVLKYLVQTGKAKQLGSGKYLVI